MMILCSGGTTHRRSYKRTELSKRRSPTNLLAVTCKTPCLPACPAACLALPWSATSTTSSYVLHCWQHPLSWLIDNNNNNNIILFFLSIILLFSIMKCKNIILIVSCSHKFQYYLFFYTLMIIKIIFVNAYLKIMYVKLVIIRSGNILLLVLK